MKYRHLMRVLAALVVAMAYPPGDATAASESRVLPRWSAQAASAQRFAQTRQGRVGWVVLNHRGVAVAGWRMHARFQSASVFKTMLAVCWLNDP